MQQRMETETSGEHSTLLEYVQEEHEDEDMKSYNAFIELVGCGPFQAFLGVYHALGWIIVSIQYPLLIFLPAILKCEWQLGNFEISAIASSNRIGMCIGVLLIGPIMDRYGKKNVYIISTALNSLSFIVNTVCPNVQSICLCCFLTGFTGSILTSVDGYFVDFLPFKFRSASICIGHLFGSMAVIIGQEISYVMIDRFTWKIWLYTLSTPSLLTFFLSFLIPTSPRYKLQCGDVSNSYKTLSKAAQINRSILPEEKYLMKENQNKSSFNDLRVHIANLEFIPTLFLLLASFFTGLCYSANVLYSSDRADYQSRMISSTNASDCIYITAEENRDYVIRSCAEILGVFIALLLTHSKRKNAFIGSYFIASIVQMICLLPNTILETCCNFVARAILGGLLTLNFIYTSEYFPSCVRAFGMGINYCIYMVGAILAPFYVNYSKTISPLFYSIGVAIMEFIAGILCFFLIETKDTEIE